MTQASRVYGCTFQEKRERKGKKRKNKQRKRKKVRREEETKIEATKEVEHKCHPSHSKQHEEHETTKCTTRPSETPKTEPLLCSRILRRQVLRWLHCTALFHYIASILYCLHWRFRVRLFISVRVCIILLVLIRI